MPRASLLVLFLVGEESGRKASFYSMLCRCDLTRQIFRSWSPGPDVICEHCGELHDLDQSNEPLRYLVKVSPQTMRELRLLAGCEEEALAGEHGHGPPQNRGRSGPKDDGSDLGA